MAYKNKDRQREMHKLYRINNKLKVNLWNKGFDTHIVRMYSGMKARVEGRSTKGKHLYEGLSILPKDVFKAFAKASKEYRQLWEVWKESNYNRLLTPSVNRKDTTKGYELDNIEFITTQENCKLAHVGRTFYRGRFSK